MVANLVRRTWGGRAWRVEGDGGEGFDVRYCPWGVNRESVWVDGVKVVRRRDGATMSHGYRFRVGGHMARLVVELNWWGDWLFPLCYPDLRHVRLEVDGVVVYEEGRPRRRRDDELRWAEEAEGFAVVLPARAGRAERTGVNRSGGC